MKRICSRILALALCLSMAAASALAADATVLPEESSGYRRILSVVTVGDTVYMLTNTGVEADFYRWKADMSQAEAIAGGLIYAERFSTTEQAAETIPSLSTDEHSDAEHALSFLFADGEKLYGYNGIENLIFTIDVTEDGLSYTDVTTLQRIGSNRPVDVVKIGDWLLWHEIDQDSRNYAGRLLAYNLAAGTVKEAVLPGIQAIDGYKDSKLLVICNAQSPQRDKGSYGVYAYDPATDERSLLGYLPTGLTVTDVAYSQELDMLVYSDSTRVMGWNAENGAEQIGFIPVTYANVEEILGDSVICSDTERIEARGIAKGFSTAHSLRVLEGYLNDATRSFSEKYPEVPFYYMHAHEAGYDYKALLSDEEETPDLVQLIASEGYYDELLDGGYLLDLSAYPAIKEYVDVLYPVYRELATEDGAIYGVPVYVDSYNGWFINKAVMNAMGLTEADIPTSLTGLCEFATKWNNEYAEKYPHYTLINNTENYREWFLEAMLEGWSGYCQYHGKELTFDDPIFREMLSALDAAELDKLDAGLKETNPEASEYKQALIWTGIKDVGNWETYMEDYSDRIFIPLTLTPETPYVVPVDHVRLWAVNAKSENAEYAAAMLAEKIAAMDESHAYVLRSDMTEPVKEKDYDAVLAYEQAKLDALVVCLDESVNRATIEKRIAEQKAYMETELLRLLYYIMPSAIENYVNVIAPASFIAMPDAVTGARSAQVSGLINRYLIGTLDADSFIAKMDEFLKNQK